MVCVDSGVQDRDFHAFALADPMGLVESQSFDMPLIVTDLVGRDMSCQCDRGCHCQRQRHECAEPACRSLPYVVTSAAVPDLVICER